jgi:hypothetical protein
VDTPAALVKVYGDYQLRGEPLGTLGRIQEDFMQASREELKLLAQRLLDPQKLQVFVVGDKTTQVRANDGSEITLEEDLKDLASQLGIPYEEIPLR